MPFSGNTYTPPAGATSAAPGQTVQSAVWNSIHSDLATALTQVMSQLTSFNSIRNQAFSNGGFEIWQRFSGGSSSITVNASATQYTADRWYLNTGANQQCTVAAVAGLTSQSVLAAKITRNNGQTGTTALTFGFPFDNIATDDISRMLGKKVTLSFVAKAGANWSPTGGTLSYAINAGTGNPVKFSSGSYAGASVPLTGTVILTTGGGATTVQATSSVIIPTTTNQMEITFSWTPVGTAGADDSVTIDDVQLEINESAQTWTPTIYDRVPFDICLAACKRHYVSTFPYGSPPLQAGGNAGALIAYAISTTQKVAIFWQFPVEMRTVPAITTFNPQGASANWQDHTTSVSVVAVVDTSAPGTKGIYITASATTSLASNDLLYIHAQADAGI